MAAEDNMMTLEEFLAKARAGPLEKRWTPCRELVWKSVCALNPILPPNPFEGSIVVFVNEVEVDDRRGKRVWS